MAKQHSSLQHTGQTNISLNITRYDNKIDAIYIKLTDGEVVKSKELAGGDLVIDLDKQGGVVGIEMLEPVKLTITKKLQKETPALAGIDIGLLQNAFQFA
jgi:uncharacterized protein YuzE